MILVHCDIDQTYLQTDFHSIRGLFRVVTEKASEKKSFPYAKDVLAALSQKSDVRLRFLSASPEQMRGVLQRKIQLDGIEYDEVFLKDATSMFKTGSFRGVLNQVSYKIPVLLKSFLQILQSHKQDVYCHLLFGDDSEDDPIIYSVFESIINKKLSYDSFELQTVLEACSVSEGIVKKIQKLSKKIQRFEYETRIIVLIHMTKQGPIQRFLSFQDFLVPVFNWLQVAILLCDIGVFSKEILNNITRTTAQFAIDGNQTSLERVCSREQRFHFLDLDLKNERVLPKENHPLFHQRQKNSLLNIIQTWRKQ